MSDSENPKKINWQFTVTEHKLKNQWDLDVLAEYLGDNSIEFTFVSKSTRALLTLTKQNLQEEKQTIHFYLDLIDEKQKLRLTFQINDKDVVIGKWDIEDPDGIKEIREIAENICKALNHPRAPEKQSS